MTVCFFVFRKFQKELSEHKKNSPEGLFLNYSVINYFTNVV